MKKTKNKILVTGFPYVRERYFATWRHVSEPERFRFLLPDRWTAKKGKVAFSPPHDDRVTTAKAYFHDSDTPLIGGLFKGWMPAFPVHLWRMRGEVGLVYACSEPVLLSTLYFGLFTKLLGKKLVLFSWENIPYEKKFRGLSRFLHLSLVTLNLSLSDGLICGNPESLELHRKYLRPTSYKLKTNSSAPCAVIPMNGLDPDFFNPHLSLDIKHSTLGKYDFSEKIVFTFIGAIGYRKGIHLAVDAFAGVLRKIPNARFFIAGSGEYENQLRDRIDKSGTAGCIVRIPWLDDAGVKELLNVSDVFVYTSIPHGGWAEQFGYSMAEASLMELPVISTRSGSIPHVVLDEKTGLLVEPDNIAQLRDAMVRLAADASLRERLGKEGRAYVVGHFSHAVVAREFTRFFSQI